jgi:NADPH:quinone reductase-like Zn-dependent oxidoreductase
MSHVPTDALTASSEKKASIRVALSETLAPRLRSGAFVPVSRPNRSARLHQDNGALIVRVDDVPCPELLPTQVIIEVHACALSSADWVVKSSGWESTSDTETVGVGRDVAGIVVGTGANARGLRYGGRVACVLPPGDRQGGCTERIAVEAVSVVPVPPHVDFASAASVVSSGSAALRVAHRIKDFASVLIVGASTTTGFLASQLAGFKSASLKLLCPREDFEEMRQHLPCGTSAEWVAEVEAVGNGSLDVVVLAGGRTAASDWLAKLKPDGLMLTSEVTSTTFVQARTLLPLLSQPTPPILQTLLGMLASGRLKPPRIRAYRLEDVSEAHRSVQQGGQLGKTVVQIR